MFAFNLTVKRNNAYSHVKRNVKTRCVVVGGKMWKYVVRVGTLRTVYENCSAGHCGRANKRFILYTGNFSTGRSFWIEKNLTQSKLLFTGDSCEPSRIAFGTWLNSFMRPTTQGYKKKNRRIEEDGYNLCLIFASAVSVVLSRAAAACNKQHPE